MRTRHVLIIAEIAVLAMSCATYDGGRPSYSRNERPKVIGVDTRTQPPVLDSGDAQRTASELIAWAARSTLDEHEAVREAIQQVSRSEGVLRALCAEAFGSQSRDHSRTLIVLSLIGETKSDTGERCLTEFVQQPFPSQGHYVHGEILEQTALGTLQAKAVDGLAYRRTETADALVLRLIRSHPSRIVRAEAISAYLWNRKDSDEAKAALADVVRPDEKIFLDRVRRVPGETAATFNPKLTKFLETHPEARPPAPRKGDGRATHAPGCDVRPPDQTAPVSRRKGQ